MAEGAQNPSPLAWALIPGVFVKVRKIPPTNFAHLESPGGSSASVIRCAKLPPPSLAHLMQN